MKIIYFLELRMEKPENVIEERDSIELLAKPKEPLNTEKVYEIIIEGKIRPENEMQVVDQIEILKVARPENEIQREELTILRKARK